MATIYRFVIEQKQSGGGGRTPRDTSTSTKGAGKNRATSLFGGEKGGVEHNRKMRAINPLLNKATGGLYEKGMRVGRAALGLVKVDEAGKFAGLSGTAVAIIISFVIQTVLKIQSRERAKADKLNAQNYKQLENGFGAIHGSYEIATNLWNGQRTYNENK